MAATRGDPTPASPIAPRPVSTHEVAVAWLREALMSGRLRPGDPIRQDVVAEEIGISAIPVREALRVLEAEGQVSYRPRRGYVVVELNFADVEEIYELRRILETEAVRRALPKITEQDVADMRRAAALVDEMYATERTNEARAANREFHFILFRRAESPHLSRLIKSLWDSTEVYRAVYNNSPRELTEIGRAHRRIIRLVAKRDLARAIVELDRHRARTVEVLSRILD